MNPKKEKLLENLLSKYRNEVLVYPFTQPPEDKKKAKQAIINIHELILGLIDEV